MAELSDEQRKQLYEVDLSTVSVVDDSGGAETDIHRNLERNWRLTEELGDLAAALRQRGSIVMLVIAALLGALAAILLMSPPVGLDMRGRAAVAMLAPSLAISFLLLMLYALFEIWKAYKGVLNAIDQNRQAIDFALEYLRSTLAVEKAL